MRFRNKYGMTEPTETHNKSRNQKLSLLPPHEDGMSDSREVSMGYRTHDGASWTRTEDGHSRYHEPHDD